MSISPVSAFGLSDLVDASQSQSTLLMNLYQADITDRHKAEIKELIETYRPGQSEAYRKLSHEPMDDTFYELDRIHLNFVVHVDNRENNPQFTLLFGKKIGEGYYGLVFQGLILNSNTPIAIKHPAIVEMGCSKTSLKREHTTLKELWDGEDNVIGIQKPVILHDSPYCFCTQSQLYHEGSLYDEEANQWNLTVTLSDIPKIGRDLLKGLEHAETKGFSNDDLGGDNIFLHREKDGTLKA